MKFNTQNSAFICVLCVLTLAVALGFCVPTVSAQDDSPDGYTTQLEDGEDYWQGMKLYRTSGIEASQSYEIVNSASGDVVWTKDSNSEGELYLDTQYISEGSFKLINRTSGDEVLSFSIKKQDLTISPPEKTYIKGSGGTVSYDLNSNRNSYDLAVSSSILSNEEIKDVFNSYSPESKDVVRDSRKEVVLNDISDTLQLDPTSLSQNYYYFNYYVVDSTAEASSQLQVTQDSSNQNTDGTNSTDGYASIFIEDRTNLSETTVTEITVDRLDLSEGGFLVIYDDGQLTKTTNYFDEGNYTNLRFSVSIPIESASTIKAIAYKDSNNDRQFTQGNDKPYQTSGSIVQETAQVHPKVEQTSEDNTTDENTTDENQNNDSNPPSDGDNNTTDEGTTPDGDSNNDTEQETNSSDSSSERNGQNLLPDTSILFLILGGIGGLFGIIIVALGIRKVLGSYIDTSTVKDKASDHLPLPPGPDSEHTTEYDEASSQEVRDEEQSSTEMEDDEDTMPEDRFDEETTEEAPEEEFERGTNRASGFQTDENATVQSETDGPPDPKDYSAEENDKENDSESDSEPDNIVSGEKSKEIRPEESPLGPDDEESEITEASFTPPENASNEYAEDGQTEESDVSDSTQDEIEEEKTVDETEETDEESESDNSDGGDPLSDF